MVKGKGGFSIKTVLRNHANKNTPHRNYDFMLFSAIKSIGCAMSLERKKTWNIYLKQSI